MCIHLFHPFIPQKILNILAIINSVCHAHKSALASSRFWFQFFGIIVEGSVCTLSTQHWLGLSHRSGLYRPTFTECFSKENRDLKGWRGPHRAAGNATSSLEQDTQGDTVAKSDSSPQLSDSAQLLQCTASISSSRNCVTVLFSLRKGNPAIPQAGSAYVWSLSWGSWNQKGTPIETAPWSHRRAPRRVKAGTAVTFARNLPAPFHVNILWTEQKWQNQSITPEPTQRGIERLTEIDDIPAGILHWFGQPCDWNRQRFIVQARTLAPLDCLDFFLCAPAYLFPSSSPACSIRMLIWLYIPRGEALCSHLHDAREITRAVSDISGQNDRWCSPAKAGSCSAFFF